MPSQHKRSIQRLANRMRMVAHIAHERDFDPDVTRTLLQGTLQGTDLRS
jgi:hypothetical protein